MIKTRITELLNIEYPVFQGSMARIAYAQLASSVSEAGGLGIITGNGLDAEKLRQQIKLCRTLTDKPFGVNIVMQDISDTVENFVNMLIEENVKIVITSAGSPKKWLPVMKEHGMIVMCVVGNVIQAQKCEALGADAIIAEGCESGGHIGEITTMVLTPAVCDAVKIPVVTAGGIADGRGMAAAFMLGAEGVQCGTAFLLTEEATVSDEYKKRVLAAGIGDTVVTGRTVRDAVRCIKNPLTEEMIRLEIEGGHEADIIELGKGSLGRAVTDGDWENGSFMSGQCTGLIHEISTCRKVIEKMTADCEKLLK